MNERDRVFDVAKGIGIILVIYNHCSPIIFGKIISLFHVPLFFFISGILCNKKDFSKISFLDFVNKKRKSLLFPYWIAGIIDFIIYMIVSPNFFIPKHNIVHQMIYFLLGMRNYNYYYFTGALWFLTALFSCELIAFVLVKFVNHKAIFLGSIIVGCVAIILTNTCVFRYSLPFNLDSLIYLFPIWGLGYMLGSKKIVVDIKTLALQILGLLFFLLLILRKNGYIDVFSMDVGNPYIYFVGAIAGSYLIVLIANGIVLYLNKKITSLFVFVGMNSIYFLVIHQQMVLHPLNSYNIVWDSGFLNFIFRFILCLIVPVIWILIKKGIDSKCFMRRIK